MPNFIDIPTETMNKAKENRLKYFEQQIAELQLNIRIYEANVAVFGTPSDSTSLSNEIAKLDRMTLNYQTVKDME
jgi:hypothetical protein